MSVARPDRAFFLIAAAGALAYVSLPHGSAIYNRWFQLFPVAAVAATLVGVYVNRPRSAAPWLLVALSGLCAVTADAVGAIYAERATTVPFPSAADVFALLSSLILAAALLLMIRRQVPGRDWPSLVDAGIVTAGVGTFAWAFVVQPRLQEASGVETAVALAYPALDILLLSMAARMVLSPSIRSPAFALVTTALVFQLVGDAMYGFGSLHGWYRPGDPIDMFFVVSALLWGTAALHPSMVDLTEPTTDPESGLSRARLALLATATLMVPLTQFTSALQTGDTDRLVLIGGSGVLATLVIVRLAGLVSRHQRGERREHALREAAAALAAAWREEDIHRVAVDSALQVVGSEGTTVALALADGRVVAAAGEHAATLLRGGLGEVPPGGVLTPVELTAQSGTFGTLAVLSPERPPRHAREAVETLAAQAALALEGVVLAESLHERQSAERFRSLVQNSSDVILLLEEDLTIRYHTPSTLPVLGYPESALVGVRLADLVEPSAAAELRTFVTELRATPGVALLPRDLPLRRADGSVCRLESVFNNLLADPNVAGLVVTARDVTERRALEEQLAHQAFHDSLTGLANRVLFADRVTHALERGRRRSTLSAVLLVDLDDFKTVNDSLGHAAGDELLVGVARRLEACLRPEDTCARLGGDEFAVLVEDIPDLDAAVTVARRVADAIAEPVTVLGSEVAVQASVGIALGSAGQTAAEILRSADLAMYQAKDDDKLRFALYEPSMHERVLERLSLKADLRRAVASGEFELHYQPIVALVSGEVVAVEALVRWQHPERGLMPPDEFIPLAEETGLILPLGAHVLDAACRQVREWRDRVNGDLAVSVNISAKQLGSSLLTHEVTAALARSGLPPQALTLEITESMLLDSEAVISRLARLRKLGVRIAIDDFGTGYSSLDYLRRFPVDTLKIAKEFVAELHANGEHERLAFAILRLASTLELEIVAEGIEQPGQRDLLRRLDCRLGQGRFFSEALPPAELEPYLRRALVA